MSLVEQHRAKRKAQKKDDKKDECEKEIEKEERLKKVGSLSFLLHTQNLTSVPAITSVILAMFFYASPCLCLHFAGIRT